MTRRITKLMAALALLLFLAPTMTSRADEVTYNFSTGGTYNSNVTPATNTWVTDYFTILQEKGNSSNAPANYLTAPRWYKDNTITITPASNVTITTIVINCSAANYNGQTITASTGSVSANGNNSTWTGSITASEPLVLTMGKQCRPSSLNVTYTVSGATPTCAAPTFSPAAGGYTSAQNVTISCSTEGATIYYTTNGTDPTTSSNVYSSAINVNANMTIKAMAAATGYENSAIATAAYTIINLDHAGTLDDPYSVSDARTAIDAGTGTQGVYATGIVSAIPTAWNSQYNNITFNMVDEEGDEEFLQAYRCTSGTGVDASTVAVGDVVVVYGNLTFHSASSTYEFSSGCQLVSLEHPATVVATPTFNPNGGTFTEVQTVTISCETPNVNIYYTTDGSNPDDESTIYTGPITVSESMTLKAKAYDSNDNESAIGTATFTINLPYSGDPYARVNDVSYLTDGAKVVFAARFDTNTNQYYAMTANASGKPAGVLFTSATSNDLEVLPAAIVNSESTYCWTVGVTSNGYTFTNASGQVIGWSSSTNFATGGDNTEWTVELGTSGESAMVPNYEAFNIVNIGTTNTNTTRAIALNSSHNFGPYAISNNNNAEYNLSIDIFVQGAEPVAIPSIAASDVELTYDATSGEIAYTLTNPAQGGSMSASTTANWITLGSNFESPIAFTCTANTEGTARTATVTLTYTYNRETITKDVTVTQAAAPVTVVYTTIPEIFAAATSTETNVLVTFGNWVVSGVSTNGKNVFVTDNQGNGFVIYYTSDMSQTYSVGDILAGTEVSCSLKLFNGFAELLNVNAEDLTITEGGTVTEANIAMADLTGVNTGALVSYENLTCNVSNNKYYLTDGTTTLQVYNSLYAFGALTDGKTYNITGIYQQYNSTKEILPRSADDIEEVGATEPTITVTPAEVNAPFAGADGALAITYENIPELISFDIQFCDANGEELEGDDPEWIYAEITEPTETEGYTVSYIIEENDGEARSAYFKVYTFVENGDDLEEVYSNLVTISQAQYVVDYAELPFEFDGGKADIETTNGLTQNGLGGDYGSSPKLKFDGANDWVILHFIGEPGVLTFDIKGNGSGSDPWAGIFKVQVSVDGVTYTDLATYTELGATQHETFNNLTSDVKYIKWIYIEKTVGNVALGNITLAAYTGPVASITVNPAEVNEDANEHNGTLDLTYENLTITEMGDFDIQYCNAEGKEAETPDWIEVEVAEQDPSVGEGYVVSYFMLENEGDARTAYFKVYAMDDETNLVYSNLVTINQAAYVAPSTGDKYVKVTSLTDLTEGQYLIVYEDGNVAFDGSLEVLDAVNNTISVNINNNEIEVTSQTTASEFTIAAITDGYSIQSASGYYIGQTSDANGLQSSNETIYTNAITFVDGDADVVSGNAHLRFNSASNQARFRYFKSSSYTGQKAIQLYKKVEETPVIETIYLPISGYGTSNGGYHLIATPIDGIDPANVGNMTNGTFDLYMFDQSGDEFGNEWINYEQDVNVFAFDALVAGLGYLYAHDTDTTLIFTGTPVDGDSYDVSLVLDDECEFPGWNLVGNSFNTDAYIDRDYYVMNEDGDRFIEQGKENAIARMQGIFVLANTDGDELTFSKQNPNTQGEKVVINVTSNRSNLVDRAAIRFGQGYQLPKFMLNPYDTKLYIPQGDNDYAVVRSANEGEMPVSFKAAENGTYTISISTEEVEMEYMHLIDHMTGADIDLLATPSYSFEANTTDNANRFSLMFRTDAVNENEGNSTFAFFNGSEWIINSNGEATLQVVNTLGHVISSETIKGNATVSTSNLSAGVYVMRLMNGENVMTQKVVVK